MMRTVLALVLLAILFGGCVTASDGDKSLEQMIRNHNAALETAG
jgi:PBP1b-binding outer membrane lipoprotein LpoB